MQAIGGAFARRSSAGLRRKFPRLHANRKALHGLQVPVHRASQSLWTRLMPYVRRSLFQGTTEDPWEHWAWIIS